MIDVRVANFNEGVLELVLKQFSGFVRLETKNGAPLIEIGPIDATGRAKINICDSAEAVKCLGAVKDFRGTR